MSQILQDDIFCGSRLSVDSKYILDFVSRLQDLCQQTASQDSLVAAHNSMAVYTVEMLKFVTGHRAVSDPFYSFDLFNLNQELVFIEDKVTSSRHEARIAWLPPLAQQQFSNYLAHLRSLSRFIRTSNADLADQIWATTELGYPRSLPLFFFLEETDGVLSWIRVKPASLKIQLGSTWLLPLNTNRHLLSTWLHSNNCPSELVDAQLGHAEVGCYEFGNRSPLSPGRIKQQILPLLEQYLAEWGWKVIVGLRAPNRTPAIRPAHSAHSLVSKATFGTEARTSFREDSLRKDSEVVSALFKSKFPAGPPHAIDDADVEAMQNAISLDSPQNRLLIRLTLLRRHLSKLKRAGTSVRVPGCLAIAQPEPSIFSIQSSQSITDFEVTRDKFLSTLADKVGETPTQERRIAEILVSACIFGAQNSSKFLDEVACGLVGRLYRFDDEIFAEVSRSVSSPILRWFPDDMTWALLIGYSNIVKSSAAPSVAQVKKHLIELLKTLFGPHYKKTSTRQSVSELLSPLLILSKTWWRIHLPGVIRAYAEGEISCASAPLSNWLRLRMGKNGVISASTVPTSSYIAFDDIPIINELPSTTAAYKQSLNSWNEIKPVIGSSKKKEVLSDENQRSSAKKVRIESRALDLLAAKSDQLTPVAQLITAWVIHLCRHGTKNKPILAASSISTYTRTISPLLIGLTLNENFLSLPDFAIEETYRKLLEASPRKDLGYVVARLKEFHFFLESSYGVPQLDWSEVIGDGFADTDSVDAGIVTLEQYEFSLRSLLNDTRHSSRDQLKHAAVLFFAYRFGLRAGEIFRLTVSDIILDGDELVLYIRNSVYGETKTENGVRQLPLIGTLSEDEAGLVNKWLAHIDVYAEDDELTGLMTKVASQRDIVDRSACVNVVVEALRNATGDNETRLRHLRHTCATRLFLSMMLEDVPVGYIGDLYQSLWGDFTPQQVRNLLVGDPRLSRRGIYAMALYMGHGSPDTTLRHYVHLADVLLKYHLDCQSIKVDDKASAYAFQSSYANIRLLKSRMGVSYSFKEMAAHFTRRSKIPSPRLAPHIRASTATATKHQNRTSTLAPSDIDRLLLLATMRNSTEGLADRFLITDKTVRSILFSASQIQEQSGFTDFAIPSTHSGDVWLPIPMERVKTLEKESQRVRHFLDQAFQAIPDLQKLNSAVAIWANSHYPNSNCLLIQKRSEVEQFLEAMKVLGLSASAFEAIIPKGLNENEAKYWEIAEKWLTSIGLTINHAARLPLIYSKLRSDNRIGLILHSSHSHKLGFQRTLDRVLYISLVWVTQAEKLLID